MRHKLDAVIGLFGSPRRFSDGATSACVDLMREFLRREALWANALGIAERLPFAALPESVSPGIELSCDLFKLMDSFSRSLIEGYCCVHLLKWYQIPKSVIQTSGPLLPVDPYLPLLKLFELGGYFTREHRIFLEVNGSTGIHAGMVQSGCLDIPFASVDDG